MPRKRQLLHKILMVMRLTALFLLVAALHVSAKTFSQRIRLTAHNISLDKVLTSIQEQSGYSILWDQELIGKMKVADIDIKDASLTDALDKCFEGLPLKYSIKDNTVLIKTAPALSPEADAFSTVPPPGLVRIYVVDSTGQPLEGASVQVKGTNYVAQTDFKGLAVLKEVAGNAVLIVSFVGYEPKTVAVKGNSSLRVALRIGNNSLDEMQIIAYGSVSKRLNTGDVSTVKAADIEKQPVPGILQALEGRVPGLTITQTSGMPGSGYNIMLRGQNGVSTGSEPTAPLIVVDGVPFLNMTNLNPNDALDFINPKDVESVDVLKDADATSIYGSRGANGVILITTKSGKPGPTAIDASVNSGANVYTRISPMMNTPQYLEMRKEAFSNDGIAPTASNAPDLVTWSPTAYTNWSKMLIEQPSTYTDAQIGVSGGSGGTSFRVNAGYNRLTPPVEGNFSSQRGSLTFSLSNTSANGKFHLDLTSMYSIGKTLTPGIDPTSFTYLPPNIPALRNPDGTLNWVNGMPNPYAGALQTSTSNTKNLLSGVSLSYRVLQGLTLSASVNYTYGNFSNQLLSPLASENPAYGYLSGSAGVSTNNVSQIHIDPSVEYKHRILGGTLTALAGAIYEEGVTQTQYIYATNFISDLTLQNLGSAASVYVTPTYSKDLYGGFFGRLNYNINDEYILQFTTMHDGSSTFGPDHRFATFASVAPAWIFTRASFFKEALPFLSFGKVRGSYGSSGLSGAPAYSYLDLYSTTTTFSYQGQPTLQSQQLSNPNLAWQSIRKLEVALELGFLHDRLYVSGDWYRNRSSDQVLSEPLPSITGFGSVNVNVPADIQNTGWEFEARSTNIRSRKFEWTTFFNLGWVRNKLLSYPNLQNSPFANQLVVGQPIYALKKLIGAGVNPATGIYQFLSQSGELTSSPAIPGDNTALVNRVPRYNGGMENTFRYGSFSLSAMLAYSKQLGDYAMGGASNNIPGFMANQPATVLKNHWQAPGDHASVEQFTETYGAAYYAFNDANNSTMGYADASYIRLKTLMISYSVYKNWLRVLHIKSAGLSLSAQNLLTITHYPGNDPENQAATVLPPLKTFAAGLNVAF